MSVLPVFWELPGLRDLRRCAVMGVLNVTPDSFSDGGAWDTPDAAVKHGRQLLADGADIVDVGGESTRPGAARVDADEELRRVLPVVRALAADGAVVSIDTSRAAVAAACVDAGARIVNDVTGGRGDPGMGPLVASTGVTYVLMHSRGSSEDMQQLTSYGDDVVSTVAAELTESLERLTDAGVRREQVVLDPGLGFAKVGGQSLLLLGALDELHALGRPLLIGASRKSFLGQVLGDRPVTERDDATQAVTALVAWQGAWAVRVHEVRPAADAVRVVAAIRAAS